MDDDDVIRCVDMFNEENKDNKEKGTCDVLIEILYSVKLNTIRGMEKENKVVKERYENKIIDLENIVSGDGKIILWCKIFLFIFFVIIVLLCAIIYYLRGGLGEKVISGFFDSYVIHLFVIDKVVAC